MHTVSLLASIQLCVQWTYKVLYSYVYNAFIMQYTAMSTVSLLVIIQLCVQCIYYAVYSYAYSLLGSIVTLSDIRVCADIKLYKGLCWHEAL